MRAQGKVLYIDDEVINIRLFKFNFSRKYDVLTGASGYDGLNLLEQNDDIKVVISDMKMPNMDGIEFVQKAKEKYNDKKFFILTGFAITEQIKAAIQEKLILKYFCKPFDMKDIETSINEVI